MVTHRDLPCHRFSVGLCRGSKCPRLAGVVVPHGQHLGGMGEGEQKELVLSVHNQNSWPCRWTPTTRNRSPATLGSRASEAVCGVDTDDTIPCLNQSRYYAKGVFSFLCSKKHIFLNAGESWRLGRRHYHPL